MATVKIPPVLRAQTDGEAEVAAAHTLMESGSHSGKILLTL